MHENLEYSPRKYQSSKVSNFYQGLRLSQICNLARYFLDLQAFVFFFSLLFLSRKITGRCDYAKRCSENELNVIFN